MKKKKKNFLFNDLEIAVLGLMGLVIILLIVMMSNISSMGYEKKPSPTVTFYPLEVTADNNVVVVEEKPDEFTEQEIELMCRVCMSEASVSCFDEKQAVVATILNRLDSGKWGNSIEEVIFYPNAYSTKNNGEPNEDCYEAVMAAIEYRESFPSDMYYFRTKHYHSFGKPYAHIDKMYFSTEE